MPMYVVLADGRRVEIPVAVEDQGPEAVAAFLLAAFLLAAEALPPADAPTEE